MGGVKRDPLTEVLSVGGARRLRAAVDASSASLWDAGDVLVAELGRSPGTTVRDDSYASMRVVAEALGVEHLTVACWRTVASAWPPSTRVAGVSWGVHRCLVAVPERERVLRAFVAQCAAAGVTPGRPRLEAHLRLLAGAGRQPRPPGPPRPRCASVLVVVQRTVDRVERLGHVDAMTLAELRALAERFAAALAALDVEGEPALVAS